MNGFDVSGRLADVVPPILSWLRAFTTGAGLRGVAAVLAAAIGAAALAHLVDEGGNTEAMSFANRVSLIALEADRDAVEIAVATAHATGRPVPEFVRELAGRTPTEA